MKLQNATAQLKSFQEMNLPAPIIPALEKMQITKPTLIQSQAVPVANKGANLIAVAQTGSGKTLAFALPVLAKLNRKPEARALVMAPSREMAQQIYKVFQELTADLPMTACLAIGGITGSKQANQLKKNPRIIVATPGRMNDHLNSNKLLLQGVEIVVIDEADRMLDMGFAPQLKTIQNTLRGERQTLMFSATFTQSVESIAKLFMGGGEVFIIRSEKAEAPVETLKQKVLLIDRDKKDDRLLDELNATTGGVIIFAGDQEHTTRLGKYLKEYGYSVDFIHGGLSQGARNRVIREFRAAELRIMVTTDLLARGLDVPHVELVISYDLPFQAEDFLHRIGRTARAGRTGTAITFVTPGDARMYSLLKPYLGGAQEVKVDKDFDFVRSTQKFTAIPVGEKKRADKYEEKKSAYKGKRPGKPKARAASKPAARPTGKAPGKTFGRTSKSYAR
ncbi:MAG: DEAD/DEAH box helicase [Bdellovibrio sp.]|nr:DEAD/DEAH box helicase [Bdellovibrio sp.]